MINRLILITALFVITGCSNKGDKSSAILDKEKMQAVMWDIIRADVFTEQFVKKDTLKKASVENMQLQNKIFSLHKVTRAQYYKSYDYYISQIEQMRLILDSMTAKAERDRSKIMEKQYGGPKK